MDQLAGIQEPFMGGISGGNHDDEQHKQAQIVYGLERKDILWSRKKYKLS